MDSLRLILIILGVLVIAGIYLWTRQRARLASELPDDIMKPAREQPERDEWDVIPVVRATPEPPPAAAALEGLAGMRGEPPVGRVAPDPEPAPAPAPAEPEAERQEPSFDAASRAFGSVGEAEGERQDPHWNAAEADAMSAEAEPQPPVEELIVVMTVMAPGGEMFAGPAILEAMERADMRFTQRAIFEWHEPAHGREVFGVANILNPGTFDVDHIGGLRTPGLALFLQLPGPMPGGAAFDLMLETARLLAAELGGRVSDQSRRPITERGIADLRERADRIPALR